MKPTLAASWIFSRLWGKGFLRLQLHDVRSGQSFFCEEIEEFPSDTHPHYELNP